MAEVLKTRMAENEIKSQVECSKCRLLFPRSAVKMCSVCKIMAYCSKECQKSDWKTHKTICTPAKARNYALSMFESIVGKDQQMMLEIDAMIAARLELHKYPERVNTHSVLIHVAAPLARESKAYKLFRRDMYGPLEGFPMVTMNPFGGNGERMFEIVRVALMKNEDSPPGLGRKAVAEEARLRAMGEYPGPARQRRRLVRAYLFTESWGTVYIVRPIGKDMVDFVARFDKEIREGRKPSPNLPDTVWENLIENFNVATMTNKERKAKLMIKYDE